MFDTQGVDRLRIIPREHSYSSVKSCPVCEDTGCHIATRVYPPMTWKEIPVDANPCLVYDYYPTGKGPGKTPCGKTYRPVGVGRHVHSGQDLVAYWGLDGDDNGQLFIAPLVDWWLKFDVHKPPVVPAASEKVPEPDGIVLDLRESGNQH